MIAQRLNEADLEYKVALRCKGSEHEQLFWLRAFRRLDDIAVQFANNQTFQDDEDEESEDGSSVEDDKYEFGDDAD